MTHIRTLGVVLAITSCASWGQSSPTQGQESEAVETLKALARAAPPEMEADAFVRLAGSGRVKSKTGRIDLLEEAIQLAPLAREPVPLTTVEPRPDSLAVSRKLAFLYGLDGLSLQVRAINVLAAIDPMLARQHFQEMTLPALPALHCTDELIYDLFGLYKLLPQMLNDPMSARDRARLLNRFRQEALTLRHPGQIRPMEAAISKLNLPPSERDEIVQAFAAGIESCPLDARYFNADYRLIAGAIKALAGNSGAAGGNSLIRALRELTVRHASLPGCQMWTDARGLRAPPGPPYELFNELVFPAATDRAIREIDASALSLVPSTEVLPSPAVFWKEPPAAGFLLRAAMLRTEKGYDGKASDDWVRDYKLLLGEVDSWRRTSETLPVFFLQKAALLNDLIDIPNTTARMSIRGDLKKYFSDQPAAVVNSPAIPLLLRHLVSDAGLRMRNDNPMLWYVPVRRLFDFVGKYQDANSAKLLEEVARLNDPVILLYAKLEFEKP